MGIEFLFHICFKKYSIWHQIRDKSTKFKRLKAELKWNFPYPMLQHAEIVPGDFRPVILARLSGV